MCVCWPECKYVYHVYAGPLGILSISQNRSHKWLELLDVGCWELNTKPVKEQQVLNCSAIPLAPTKQNFINDNSCHDVDRLKIPINLIDCL